MIERDGQSLVLVVDGLGHGPPAAEAAEEAVGVFRRRSVREPVEHRSKPPTRHCEAPGARPWRSRGSTRRSAEVRYAGVGNISGVILDAARPDHEHGLA